MPGRRRLGIGVALLAVGLVSGACGSSSKSSAPTTAPSASSGAGTTSGSSASSGAGTSAGNKASAPGVTPNTIKIGFITSLTGDAASTYASSATGAEAYFDAVNKAGGVDGRQIQLVIKDDASTPAGYLTASQLLIGEGVFAILDNSSFAFGGYKAAQQAGVPVVGDGDDGPEWGQQPNTNMFSIIGDLNPSHQVVYVDLASAALFKSIGANDVGGLAYANSPSSTASIVDLKTALDDNGLKMGYENLSVPFGTTNVTSLVLALKQAGVNMAVCSCVQSTNLAVATGLKQAGSNAKMLSLGGADSTLFSSSSAAEAANGVYYTSFYPPLDIPNPSTTAFENNLKAADSSYQMGTYPPFGTTQAYLAAQLMVKGLQVAGQEPTRKSFISNLSNVTNWDSNGLMAYPLSFNHFGQSNSTYCEYFVVVSGNKFVAVDNGKDFCANLPSNL